MTPGIESTVTAVAVAVTAGSVGIGGAAAGSYAENYSLTNISATLDGTGTIASAGGIKANGISVVATDGSQIDSSTVGASLAGAIGGAGAGTSVSVGIALAYNNIQNDVTSRITDFASVNSTNGILVDAKTSSGSIKDATYTTSSGTKTLTAGQTVQLGSTYSLGGQAGRQYRYRGFTADYDITDASSQGNQSSVLLRAGNTVKQGLNSYFRYKGSEGSIVLNNENFLDTARWESISPNTYDLGAIDYANTKLWEISDGSITSTSVAASLAASFGSAAGISFSGAGANSLNRILSRTNAFINNSTVVSTGNVNIQSSSSSKIDAKVIAASAALGASGGAGVGVSIGVSIAENLIGWTTSTTESPVEVRAYVSDSGIDSTGDLNINALDNAWINAFVFAGSAAVAGGSVGVSASGAGAPGGGGPSDAGRWLVVAGCRVD
jgi:hypothetical protein